MTERKTITADQADAPGEYRLYRPEDGTDDELILELVCGSPASVSRFRMMNSDAATIGKALLEAASGLRGGIQRNHRH